MLGKSGINYGVGHDSADWIKPWRHDAHWARELAAAPTARGVDDTEELRHTQTRLGPLDDVKRTKERQTLHSP